MRRACLIACLSLLGIACGDDGLVTAPDASGRFGPLLATGSDPVTGATITTNKDDYAPGEIVHVTGSGWAPGETVHLNMTEEPDTHADVSQDVVADASGAFSLHFYDVQEHDLGVTFTLVASGATSGSRATAVFTDGTVSLSSSSPVTGVVSYGESPLATCSVTSFSLATSFVINNANRDYCFEVRAPTTTTVASVTYTFAGWVASLANGPNNIATSTGVTGATQYLRFAATGPGTGGSVAALYVSAATSAPTVLVAAGDATGNEGATLTTSGSFADADGNSTLSISGSGAGTVIDNGNGTWSWSLPTTDNGNGSVTVTATDGTSSVTDVFTWSANNVAPQATFTSPDVASGSPIVLTLSSPTDPSTVDVAAGFTYAFDCGDGNGFSSPPTTTNTAQCPTSGPTSTRAVRGKIIDKDGGERIYSDDVTITNTGPMVVIEGVDQSGNEGSTLSTSGSFSDPNNDPIAITAVGAGVVTDHGDGTWSWSYTPSDEGSGTVVVTAVAGGLSTTDSFDWVALNVAPVVSLSGPTSANEGDTKHYTFSWTDPGNDSWNRTVSCGDNGVVSNSTIDITTKQGAFDCTWTNDHVGEQVSVSLNDGDGGVDDETISVTIANVAPIVTLTGLNSANEGDTKSYSFTFTDPGADPWSHTVSCGTNGTVSNDVFNAPGTKSGSFDCTWSDEGSATVSVTVNDDDTFGKDDITVAVANVAPVVTLQGDATADEGDTKTYTYSFTDPGTDTWTETISCGANGVASNPSFTPANKSGSFDCTWADNHLDEVVSVSINDGDGGSDTETILVDIANVAPKITSITLPPPNPIPAGSNVTVGWAFTDPGSDTWTCAISWDIGQTPVAGTNSAKTCSASKILPAGVYTVTVKVTDDDGAVDDSTATDYIVVYDPNGGFVTGGGWINSPAGAWAADLAMTGKANFGFVSKYQKGANVPTGNTEFQFHAGNLNFKSTLYQWLVIAGARAQYKGEGTINGTGRYGFLLTGIDGQVSGGGGTDKFRIKIWDINNANAVVYDNGLGALEDSNVATALGGGSIVIHAK